MDPASLRRKTVVTVISKIGDRKPKADACLVTIYGQNIGQKHVLKPGEAVIGRSSQAQLQIDHESVSRRHAKIVCTDSGIVLSDMESTNGTYVNDEPITERTLTHGDLLKVGRTILKYLSTDNIEAAYYEEIHRLLTIDGLTRAFNARSAKDALTREFSRAHRYNRPLSVIVLDVDQFHELNDEYGHLAGDAVLAQLGKRLPRKLRREDVFARTGGGEFTIIAPETGKEEAAQLTERIIKVVEETSFGFDDVQIPVSLSASVVASDEVSVPEAATDVGHVGALPRQGSREFEVGNTGTGEHSTFETRTDPHDRFAVGAEQLMDSARQRLIAGKLQGRGRIAR
jgi:two-component system, cell cycle response regulator